MVRKLCPPGDTTLTIYLPDIVIGIRWVFYEDFEHPCPVSPAVIHRVYHFWSCRGSRRNHGRHQQPRHYFVLSPGTLAPRDQHQLYVCAHWKFAPFCHLHFSRKKIVRIIKINQSGRYDESIRSELDAYLYESGRSAHITLRRRSLTKTGRFKGPKWTVFLTYNFDNLKAP